MKTAVLALLAATALALSAAAQSANSTHTLKLDAGAVSPPARLEDFAWLAGHWVGTGFGGAHVEEIWTPPEGSSMSGMFRLVSQGAAQVYELCVLLPVDDTVELRLKHFTRDLKGWEEKADFVTFRLVRLAPGEACFDGLTFRLGDAGATLRVWLVTKSRTGEVAEQEMIFWRRA
jgi:Domain of unknown function (DUF6265)